MARVKKDVENMLPVPQGYHILIALPGVKDKTEGGIHLPDQHTDREHTASIVGTVISMGPDCYKDTAKFPTGPWCKIDDWVMFRSYSGTRFKIKGTEFRILNDDTVQAVIADPRLIERA